MRKRVTDVFSVTSQPGGASLIVQSGDYDAVLVTISAVGGVPANLVARPLGALSNFTQGGGVALAAPAAGASLIFGVGPGMHVPSPPPEQMILALDNPGGQVDVTAECSRWEEQPDDATAGRFETLRETLDNIAGTLRAVLDALVRRR